MKTVLLESRRFKANEIAPVMKTTEEFKTRFIALLEEFGAHVEEYEDGYGDSASISYEIKIGDKSLTLGDLWYER